jgi:hypothetical protein
LISGSLAKTRNCGKVTLAEIEQWIHE